MRLVPSLERKRCTGTSYDICGRFRICTLVAIFAISISQHSIVKAQHQEKADGELTAEPQKNDATDIVVVGQRARGAVVTDAAATVVFDARAIRGFGASSLAELLKSVGAGSSWGGANEPVTLLNGRRVAGFSAIAGLPPEAIERIDVLPPTTARQFGYAADRNVINFVTFKHFRSRQADILEGTSTDGGSANLRGTVGFTRIDGDQQLAMTLEVRDRQALRQSRRHLASSVDNVYSLGGTIARSGGMEIDPRLSLLAGFPVTSVNVPISTQDSQRLGSYVAGANQVAPTDIGRYRDLSPGNSYIGLNGTWSKPILGNVSASLNLSADRQRSSALQGLATSTLTVDQNNVGNPFDSTVTVYRYLGEIAPLRRSSKSINLHVSADLAGYLDDIGWSLTLSGDQSNQNTYSEIGFDSKVLQSLIDGSTSPIDILRARYGYNRQIDRSITVANMGSARFVVNAPLLKVPSGALNSTIAVNYNFLGLNSSSNGVKIAQRSRNTLDSTISLDLPLSTSQGKIVPLPGELSVNLTQGAAYVPMYGIGALTGYGITWSPLKKLQIILSAVGLRNPPTLEQVGAPAVTATNVPFFDPVLGVSTAITTFTGGNRALAPEQRKTSSLSINIRPFEKGDIYLNLVYSTVSIRNQAIIIAGLTDNLEAALPGRFVRDTLGNLVSADLSPINVAFERQSFISTEFHYSGKVGRLPAGSSGTSAVDFRPNLLVSFTPLMRLYDRSRLLNSSGQINLLSGGSLNGLGGKSRLEITSLIGLTFGGGGTNFTSRFASSTTSTGPESASNIVFGSLATFGFESFVFIDAPSPSAKRATITFKINNILNRRQTVMDGSGNTPERFQPAYLDPIGRTVSLTLRKIF